MKIDLHIHSSEVSPCGRLTVEDLLELYSKTDYDGFVLTNHFSAYACGKAKEKGYDFHQLYHDTIRKAQELGKKGNFLVLPGYELRFAGSDNDYLVYGVSEEDIPRFIELVPHGIENFYKQVKSERNVIIQAHPFRKGVTLAPLDSIDGIESFNIHPGHNSRVGIGARYAKLKDLLVTGGTDFHHEGHQALCLMRSKEEMKNSYDVAEAIKSRNVIFDCSGHIVIPYIY